MSLRDLEYKPDYRSGHDDLVADLFRPSLLQAKEYWRAVGYFSSTALEAFGAPLGAFLKRDGKIHLITSVELSPADLAAIAAGTATETVCNQRIEQILNTEFSDGVGDGTARLVRLLEMGRLEIKIAIPKHGTGIYHEKIGIFIDGDDLVAFTGSSNESRNAFENNRECIDVFTSWDDPDRALRKKHHFLQIWGKTDPGVSVYTFSEAARRKLLRASRRRYTAPAAFPSSDPRWRHQDEAVARFLRSKRGVLNMATGTGKTRTALRIIKALFDRNEIGTVVVSTDGNDLLDQWYREILRLRTSLVPPPRVLRHYGGHRDVDAFLLTPSDAILLTSRVPLARALARLDPKYSPRTLLIHDEVHGLGSPGNRASLTGLSDAIRFRLGLSATPEREYDQDGTEFIEQHVGPVLMTFGLEEAITRGILAPFRYFPLPFTLTDGDKRRIQGIYTQRAACAEAGSPMSDIELWIKLASVHKSSEAKMPVFREFIHAHPELLERCIFFTATQEYGNSILDIVHKYRPDFHTYYAGEDQETLRRFARGDLECLITCHRLSEGIDIQNLNNVIIFSSDRARLETIQRIGRCLRTNPVDPSKIANIVDFVRTGPRSSDPTADAARSAWLTELSSVRPE